MKEFLTFTLLVLVLAARELHSAEVKCEVKYTEWVHSIAIGHCLMQTTTTINSTGFTISPRDEAIWKLNMSNNTEIYFLPEKLADTFPNLMFYSAFECSLTEVSKINFENLGKLTSLSLSSNQIVKIASNTFEDLTSLNYLELDNNQIKFINGGALEKLNKLIRVDLYDNVCINESFNDEATFAEMSKTLTQKCGFEENVDKMLEE